MSLGSSDSGGVDDGAASYGPRPGSIAVGHPIDVASGVFFSRWQDASLGGPLRLELGRTYNTGLLVKRRAWEPLGPGWALDFDERIHQTVDGLVHIDPLGVEKPFEGPAAPVPGDVLITAEGGTELQVVDAQTLRLVRFGASRARTMALFRRSGAEADFRLAALERNAGHRIEIQRDRYGRPTRIAHVRNGRGVRLTYRNDGLLESLHLVNRLDGNGLLLSRFEYDAQYRLVATSDDRGVRERFEYDGAGRMISEVRRNGSLYRMRYDGDGRCIHVVGTNGFQERRLTYRALARATDVADSHGAVTTYEYNEAGQVLKMSQPLGEETLYAYDDRGRLAGQTLPNGQAYRYAYDGAGHLLAVTMPDGRRIVREYDPEHRLVAAVDGKRRTEFAYDDRHNTTLIKLPGGGKWQFVYDDLGDCVATVDPVGARVTNGFNELGDCVGQTTGTGAYTAFSHDAWGQVVQETNPLGQTRRWEYDRSLRMTAATDAEGRTWRYQTSPDGSTTIRQDATGRWQYHYNSCGKVTEIIDPEGLRTEYVWDTEPNQILEVKSPSGDSYRFEYDVLGRMTKRTAWDGSVTSFEWKRGALVAETNARGERTEYEYDGAARLVARKGRDDELSYEYGPDGRVALAVENGVELGFEYDLDGRIVAERQDGIEVRRRFDEKGRMVWLGSDLADNLLYEWDPDDRCAAIVRDAGAVRFTRDQLGRERVRHLGGGGRVAFTYAAAGQLASERYFPPLAPELVSDALPEPSVVREYHYDAAGRPNAIIDSIRGTTLLRHDAQGQLVAIARSGEAPEVYGYDAAGNRRTEARLAPTARYGAVFGTDVDVVSPMRALPPEDLEVTGELSRDRGNRIVRVQRDGCSYTYTYDEAGFVVAKHVILADGAQQDWRFHWNSKGRLVALTRPDGKEWRYEYDAAGRRLRKRGPDGEEIRYVWQAARILYVVKNGARESTWLAEPRTGVPIAWEDDRPHYILTNASGTPMEVVDAGGKLEWTSKHKEWGDSTPSKGAPPPQLYGQWHDEESGLNYNVFRYYDPVLGRYISPDPIGLRGGLNEYAGITSPYFDTDPLGLAPSERDPGPFVLAPRGAKPGTDPPAPGGTAYPASGPKSRSYRVGTPDNPDGGRPIQLSSATAAEVHTSNGPYMVAFNGTNEGQGSSVDAAHHADQVMMGHLVDHSGEIPGEGPILVLIRGRDVCSDCASAIDGPNGLGQQLADKTGRQVIVHEDDTPEKEPRVFTPAKEC